MKYRSFSAVFLNLLCILLLTGCTLFPLREEDRNEEKTATIGDNDQPEDPEKEIAQDSEKLIKPMPVPETETFMICISPVNVRDQASSGSNVIGELQKGVKVTVRSQKDGWIEIDFKGKAAYVYEKYLQEVSGSDGENSRAPE